MIEKETEKVNIEIENTKKGISEPNLKNISKIQEM